MMHRIKPEALKDPVIYSNGAWLRQSEATVPFMDSGFWYGDGLFETFLVENGHIFRPRKHLERMHAGMGVLQIGFPMSDDEVIALMEESIKRNQLNTALLRLMCTRGTVRGAPYDYKGDANLYLGLRYVDVQPSLPVKVAFLPEKDYPIGRMVPALKSMTYLPNILAIRDAHNQGCFEPVFVNRDGLVTECAIRNVFFIRGNTLRTPDVSLGILPGVTRDLVMELGNGMGLDIDTVPIHIDQVNDMDEGFISSTGIGIYSATWDGAPPSDYPITTKLQEAVERQVRIETS